MTREDAERFAAGLNHIDGDGDRATAVMVTMPEIRSVACGSTVPGGGWGVLLNPELNDLAMAFLAGVYADRLGFEIYPLIRRDGALLVLGEGPKAWASDEHASWFDPVEWPGE